MARERYTPDPEAQLEDPPSMAEEGLPSYVQPDWRYENAIYRKYNPKTEIAPERFLPMGAAASPLLDMQIQHMLDTLRPDPSQAPQFGMPQGYDTVLPWELEMGAPFPPAEGQVEDRRNTVLPTLLRELTVTGKRRK